MLADDPYPVGDPAGMRNLAALLRREASGIDARADTAAQRVSGLSFRGPKAERFRDSVAETRGDSRRIADALVQVADSLAHAAAVVEADQRAWIAARQRMMEEQR